mmetsp:Transcript_6670/g.7747  ORF Transcript_6670/g.7747 Transcript_6670/m.7747 type:complete len:148 (+) Transcript_6670:134-577(+)|eukprot:CAMPEP_0198275414 /NCGR_PEP_ID=MMETSP1447-20131203/64464_1 /TAXON_ID=420782 /ORGANISM="Chaetoceros dichaeta, Strain CCMP1751" /LENGTH=147 /DNA_ID=CAMNT_0043970239 /DNA_START=94 /DNA_END=534 /DNA_ORIENTATION=+
MTLSKRTIILSLITAITIPGTHAFQLSSHKVDNTGRPSPSTSSSYAKTQATATTSTTTSLNDGSSSIEELEFKIFPDGRVEETVRGIKGGGCHKITDEINAQLGKVVDSKPTEEMFEEKIFLEETVSVTEQGGLKEGDSGWEGASSW